MPFSTMSRKYKFESAHWLPHVPEGHKCRRVHGHNYVFEVVLRGRLSPQGWLLDFWDLDTIIKPTIDIVDHRLLNDIDGLENPTAEIIALWLLSRIDTAVKNFQLHSGSNQSVKVSAVHVYETPDACASAVSSVRGSGRQNDLTTLS